MKLLLGTLMVLGLMATESYAAQAICTAQARSAQTFSKHTEYNVPPHSNVKYALRQACQKALRKCKRKARVPQNCQTIKAKVVFPALQGWYGPNNGHYYDRPGRDGRRGRR